MPKSSKSPGIIPIFVLVAIGVAVLVGGTYVIRSQFVKTGQSGKSVIDEKAVERQIQNPQDLPSLTPTPKGETANNRPVVYTPVYEKSDPRREPSFSMTPPSGWEKVTQPGEGLKIQFRHPEEDRTDMEDGLYVKSNAQIAVFMDTQSNATLDQLVSAAKSASQKSYEKVTFLSEQKTTLAGQDAYYFETELFEKGVSLRSIDYYILANGYPIRIGGTALSSAWTKRSNDIKSSLNSFKLLD